MAAKPSHAKYGRKSMPAALLIFQNIIIVISTAAQSRTISKRAMSTLWRPKNINDQRAFRISWIMKKASAGKTGFIFFSFHTSQAAIPIMT